MDISPDYSWAYYNLGVLDYEEGDDESALENLRQTISLNPADMEAYKILSKITAKKGYFDEAKSIIENAINNCGDNGDLYYYLARIFLNLGDKENYEKNVSLALKNSNSLSVSIEQVQHEMNSIK